MIGQNPQYYKKGEYSKDELESGEAAQRFGKARITKFVRSAGGARTTKSQYRDIEPAPRLIAANCAYFKIFDAK